MRTIILTVCLACLCTAQQKPAANTDSPSTNLPAHQIGPNDLLSISVYDAPEISKLVRVGADGNIRIPMLKTPILASGKLPSQLEGAVADALEKEEILVAPAVTVTVAEYSSRPINVAGAVKSPQTFQAIGPMRLLDAISRGGGLTEDAGNDILVHLPGSPVQRVSVKSLFQSTDPAANISLRGGEDIRVIEVGKAFVVGNVRKPGAFALRDSEESTVLQMIALAEGLTPFSSKQAFIYRKSQSGGRREVVVELDQILRRKHPDVAIAADDILYIPENKGRKLGIAALERALAFGSTAGATALIYSNR